MSAIRVLIVEDNEIFGRGLKDWLSRVGDVEVIAAVQTSEDAISIAAETAPEVILMDLQLKDDVGGIETTRRILASQPDARVLVLTMYQDDAHVRDAISAGARGYALKDSGPGNILRAIRAVHQNQFIFDPEVAGFVVAAAAMSEPQRAFTTLTDREYQILDRLARGYDTAQIARNMHIDPKTVQNNVSSILKKLGARDRAQAVVMAKDAGMAPRWSGPLA